MAMPDLSFETTHGQRRDFRLAVLAGIGREPLDPRITVSTDRYGYYATTQEERDINTGDLIEDRIVDASDVRVVCYDWTLGVDGSVSAGLDFMTRGQYLAWAIRSRSVCPRTDTVPTSAATQPKKIERHEAERMLVNFIRNQKIINEKLVNDPFRFQDAIDKIKGNFVAI